MRIWLVSLFQILLLNYAFSQEIDKPLTEITTVDGLKHIGAILHPGDSLFFLWQNQELFSLKRLDEFTQVFHVHELERIRIRRDGNFGSGVRKGAIVGAIVSFPVLLIPTEDPYAGIGKAFVVGIILPTSAITGGIIGAMQGIDYDFMTQGSCETYQKILPKLQKNAIFPRSLPPEMKAYIERQRQLHPSPFAEPPVVSKQRQPPFAPLLPRLHLGYAVGLIDTRANNDIEQAYKSSGFQITDRAYEYKEYPFCHSIEAAYSMTYRYRLELEWSNMIRHYVGTDWVSESAYRSSTGLTLGYVLKEIEPPFISQFEICVGAGLSYNKLLFERSAYIVGEEFFPPFKLENKAFGGYAKASVDYYFWKNLSIQLRVMARLLPSVKVAEIRGKDVTLKQHSINFSAVDASLGARVHF
jgi:hypothetical protein